MERKLLYNLIFSDLPKEKKSDLFNTLKNIPNNKYDPDTLRLITILNLIDKAGKTIDEKTVRTYLSFYTFDIIKYFFETDTEKIEVEEAIKLFHQEKVYEQNILSLKKLTDEYIETGDPELLQKANLIKTSREETITDSKGFVNRTFAKLESIKSGEDKDRLSLRPQFFILDIITHGFERGELILLAARPSVGKSAFAIAFLNHFSKNYKTMLVSYEMTVEEIGMRMIQAKTGIYSDIFYHKDKFTEEVLQKVKVEGEKFLKQNIKIEDNPPSDFLALRELVKREKERNGLDVLIIDYLGLIRSFAPGEQYNPYVTTSQISAHMKLLAKELDIVLILLQQVSRKAATDRKDAAYKPLVLTDLRDSGSLEQDANKVFLFWNKEPENEIEREKIKIGVQTLIVSLAKNRGGKSNQQIEYIFNKGLQRITEGRWITAPPSWEERDNR